MPLSRGRSPGISSSPTQAITATSVLFAVDIRLFTPIFGGVVDYTPASVPALRHWGFMIFGIGVLMIVAAFRPWLRFETMLFCTLEKCFIVYLFLANLGEPWGKGYLGAAHKFEAAHVKSPKI